MDPIDISTEGTIDFQCDMLFDHALDRVRDTCGNALDVVTRGSPPILGPVEPIMIPKSLARVTNFISQNEGQLSSTL